MLLISPQSQSSPRPCRTDWQWLRALGTATLLWLGLSACQSQPPPAAPIRHDLVTSARQWRATCGLARARDRLSEALVRLDADGGALEQRVLRANADKTLRPPDSLATFTPAQRRRTGIFLVLGYHPKAGRSEPVIRHLETFLKANGWHAVLIPLPLYGTADEDAAAIQLSLAKELPSLQRAVLVGFSKGSLDWMHWFAKYADQLPASQRNKIRLMVSFAGALRGAAVAKWLADGRGPVPALLRWQLQRHTPRALAAVKSAAPDPWAVGEPLVLTKLLPRLRSVSVVAVPEGADGQTHADGKFNLLARLATSQWQWLGPVDGLVETAGQVLPAEAAVPQHIVRVFGSHAVLDGHYLNGAPVSRIYQKHDGNYWQGGAELLDDLLRALPRAWLK